MSVAKYLNMQENKRMLLMPKFVYYLLTLSCRANFVEVASLIYRIIVYSVISTFVHMSRKNGENTKHATVELV
jgi:hypothetical protein